MPGQNHITVINLFKTLPLCKKPETLTYYWKVELRFRRLKEIITIYIYKKNERKQEVLRHLREMGLELGLGNGTEKSCCFSAEITQT